MLFSLASLERRGLDLGCVIFGGAVEVFCFFLGGWGLLELDEEGLLGLFAYHV
jgi:hypothetical protein